MALNTVQNYIDAARFQIQDTVQPYRVLDADFLSALNFGISETYKHRPDFFIGLGGVPPSYSNLNSVVNYPVGYQMDLLFFIAGYVTLTDSEPSQDQRAMAFLQKLIISLKTPGV